MTSFHRIYSCVLTLIVLGGSVALAPAIGQATHEKIWDQLIADAYTAHDGRVRQQLPAHSGLPPVLDLSTSTQITGVRRAAWYIWDAKLFPDGVFSDPGLPGPSEATSIATTFLDGTGFYDLPVRDSSVIVRATPLTQEVYFDPAHALVYTCVSLNLSSVLAQKRRGRVAAGQILSGLEYGGTIRFPSGHEETFLVANSGFLEIGKEYVLFLWKPKSSLDIYMVGTTYLISDSRVYRIGLSNQSIYEGMPLDRFLARLKSAIARNVDTD